MANARLFFIITCLLQLTLLAAARELHQAASDSLALDQPQFFPTTCEKVCKTGSDFHIPLPTAPSVAVGNVASQWATALLVQVMMVVEGRGMHCLRATGCCQQLLRLEGYVNVVKLALVVVNKLQQLWAKSSLGLARCCRSAPCCSTVLGG